MIARRIVLAVGIAVLLALGALVAASPVAAAPRLVPVLAGLDSPVLVTHARDGSGRLFVVEQRGVIKVLRPGAAAPTVFLDISARVLAGGERGLLGLAFHPQFSGNRRLFVNYTRRPDGATVIAEYRASAADPDSADAAETLLLVIPQPFANHNGGMVEFGPDAFLYIAVGDGGSGNDPGDRAQDAGELLGKILRIDVDRPSGNQPYSSPPDNPFAGSGEGRAEIYAHGLRNPWRFSFDRATGDLLAGDVGQGAVEEIDVVVRGGNYGWRIWEGSRCTGNDPGRCEQGGFTFPIAEYGHTGGRCSVIGGYVYRGAQGSLPAGRYVYGDLCTGEIFALEDGASRVMLDTALRISSFGEDEAGELYVVDLGGTVQRIVEGCASGGPGDPSCARLDVLASANGSAFGVGETLRATVGVDNPGLPATADFYLGVLLPDGTIAFFTSAWEIVFGQLGDFGSFHAIAPGFSLAAPFSQTLPDFLTYEWTGVEPPGDYTLFLLAAAAGALADGVLDDGEILGLATATFSFP